MPTPYERYLKGWKLAEEMMTRKKQLGLQERGVELGEQKFGFEQEQWPIQKAYTEAQTEKLRQPEEQEDPHKAWDYWTPQQQQGWLKRQAFGDQSAPDRTAYDRDTALKERHRMEYMTLRDKFDEKGMFTGSPQEFAKFKIREEQFGKEERGEATMAAVREEYVKYYAAWQKLNPTEKQIQPLVSWPEYQRQFEGGGGQGAPTYTQEQMDKYNACRDAGGDAAKCKTEAGITQ